METKSRSLVKALSYRLLGSACTSMICLLLTGRLALSAGVGTMDLVAKFGLYFLHERIWERIRFGKAKAPEYEI